MCKVFLLIPEAYRVPPPELCPDARPAVAAGIGPYPAAEPRHRHHAGGDGRKSALKAPLQPPALRSDGEQRRRLHARHRVVETERLDACRNLRDLLGTVDASVAAVRPQARYWDVADRKF
jgi:hypothetical protein